MLNDYMVRKIPAVCRYNCIQRLAICCHFLEPASRNIHLLGRKCVKRPTFDQSCTHEAPKKAEALVLEKYYYAADKKKKNINNKAPAAGVA